MLVLFPGIVQIDNADLQTLTKKTIWDNRENLHIDVNKCFRCPTIVNLSDSEAFYSITVGGSNGSLSEQVAPQVSTIFVSFLKLEVAQFFGILSSIFFFEGR